jgi:hypothetical protein
MARSKSSKVPKRIRKPCIHCHTMAIPLPGAPIILFPCDGEHHYHEMCWDVVFASWTEYRRQKKISIWPCGCKLKRSQLYAKRDGRKVKERKKENEEAGK